MVFWTPGGESFMLQAECFPKKKKPCGKYEIDILGCFGMIVHGFLSPWVVYLLLLEGTLGLLCALGRWWLKNPACIRPETHYFKGQPRTGEIVSTAVHRE
jgi:hypothetical protein